MNLAPHGQLKLSGILRLHKVFDATIFRIVFSLASLEKRQYLCAFFHCTRKFPVRIRRSVSASIVFRVHSIQIVQFILSQNEREEISINCSNNKHNELRALINYYLTYNNYTKPELALKVGISPASFYRKFKDPNTFTFSEIQKLFDTLKLTEDQKLKVV
jgi:hypothetical protein